MITIQIRLFAAHRDIVGRPELTLIQPAGATLGEVWAQLVTDHPPLARYTGRLLFAVNQQFADPTTVLHDGDEVAFIPPVSGGTAVPPNQLC